ncbi:MAG TPA: hypothetical protein VG501_07200, partial [Rhizomicrobium sp.]|nr:hypothetical protein [Rhizomicrobium sp.]
VGRYFVNAASFGLWAKMAARINRARLFGAAFPALAALAGWRSQRLRLFTDAGYDEIAGITNVAVANGRWSGSGVKVAPAAEPGDGLFDIVVMGGAPRRKLFRLLRAWRKGREPGQLRRLRAAHLTVAPTVDTHGAVMVEADGESVGVLPATFQILPGAINIRC